MKCAKIWSGIYKLKCLDCDSVHVGQSGRNFQIRVNEHIKSFFKNSPASHFALNLNLSHHSSSFTPEILHIVPKGPKMNFLENREILVAKISSENAVNDIIPVPYSPLHPKRVPQISPTVTPRKASLPWTIPTNHTGHTFSPPPTSFRSLPTPLAPPKLLYIYISPCLTSLYLKMADSAKTGRVYL